jgi:hypothetical protein
MMPSEVIKTNSCNRLEVEYDDQRRVFGERIGVGRFAIETESGFIGHGFSGHHATR